MHKYLTYRLALRKEEFELLSGCLPSSPYSEEREIRDGIRHLLLFQPSNGSAFRRRVVFDLDRDLGAR